MGGNGAFMVLLLASDIPSLNFGNGNGGYTLFDQQSQKKVVKEGNGVLGPIIRSFNRDKWGILEPLDSRSSQDNGEERCLR